MPFDRNNGADADSVISLLTNDSSAGILIVISSIIVILGLRLREIWLARAAPGRKVWEMKRVFGLFEAVFDVLYLGTALAIGGILLLTSDAYGARMLAGILALVLAAGDAFHLLPRIIVILTGREPALRAALGRGKQITSITMTVFYLLLWQVGALVLPLAPSAGWLWLAYTLGAARILLCLLPQNRWQQRHTPVHWGIWRNIPFFILGALVAVYFFLYRHAVPGLYGMWLAIAMSFAFYLPVVLWAGKNPKIGMLMLPKSCAYLWMLAMCLFI